MSDINLKKQSAYIAILTACFLPFLTFAATYDISTLGGWNSNATSFVVTLQQSDVDFCVNTNTPDFYGFYAYASYGDTFASATAVEYASTTGSISFPIYDSTVGNGKLVGVNIDCSDNAEIDNNQVYYFHAFTSNDSELTYQGLASSTLDITVISTTTTSISSSDVGILYNSILLFMIGFFGMVWLIRKH